MTETEQTDAPLLTPYQHGVMQAYKLALPIPSVAEFYKAPHAPRGTPARKPRSKWRPEGRVSMAYRMEQIKEREEHARA